MEREMDKGDTWYEWVMKRGNDKGDIWVMKRENDKGDRWVMKRENDKGDMKNNEVTRSVCLNNNTKKTEGRPVKFVSLFLIV